MKISTSSHNNNTIITVNGEIEFNNVGKLKKEVNDLIDGGCRSLILDMKDVSYIDSMAIGLLAVTHKKMKNASGKFVLINVSADLMAFLKISTIDKMLTIYDSLDEVS